MDTQNTTACMPFVYHHTDIAHLPWILRDQALKPGDNEIGDFPYDFLWATTDPLGDPTASSAGATARAGYRDGLIANVRFVLASEDFAPWAEMKASYPRWELRHIAILESAAIKMGASPRQIAEWQCRLEPLPASEWLAVEFRTWRNPRWRAVQLDAARPVGTAGIGILLDGVVFYSQQRSGADGKPTSYACSKLELTP
jgi:hypothetical protein